MSNNDWTSKLREQMADYQEPVSDDLWTSISQSLNAQSAKDVGEASFAKKNGEVPSAKKAQIIKIRRWSAAAAAVAILGIGGSYVYLHQASEEQKVATSSSSTSSAALASASTSATSSSASAHASEPVLIAKNDSYPYSASASMTARSAVSVEPAVSAQISTNEVSELISEDRAPECTAADHVQPLGTMRNGDASMKKESTSMKKQSFLMKNDEAIYDEAFWNEEKKKTVDWNVQLYAENGFMTSENAAGKGPIMMDTFEDATSNGGTLYVTSAPYLSLLKLANKPKGKHHAPLSLGAQVGMRVCERLTFNTGVVYTRTSSEFAAYDGAEYDKKQVLHYVGIPLSVNYEVWGVKQLHTYVMLGGEADFNVKNDTEVSGVKMEDGVKKDRAQFSGKASLGIQYDVVKQVGLYLEPGMKYYFDNGSEIDNTFKDKKWNFNLQFGLRVNL